MTPYQNDLEILLNTSTNNFTTQQIDTLFGNFVTKYTQFISPNDAINILDAHPLFYKHFDPEIRDNFDVIKKALVETSYNYTYVSPKLQKDPMIEEIYWEVKREEHEDAKNEWGFFGYAE